MSKKHHPRSRPYAAEMNIFYVLLVNIYYIDLFFYFFFFLLSVNANGYDV